MPIRSFLSTSLFGGSQAPKEPIINAWTETHDTCSCDFNQSTRGVYLSIFSNRALSKASGPVSNGVVTSMIMASPESLLVM